MKKFQSAGKEKNEAPYREKQKAMGMTKEETRAYARGYSAGQNRKWPSHKPPLPPNSLVREVYEAALELRDAADAICATLDEEDDFVKLLGPKIGGVDQTIRNLETWLTSTE